MWPILMYSNGSSQTHHLDEGCFVVMALVLPPAGALLIFMAASALAQAIRRRHGVKSLFNVAQIIVAAAAGLLTAHLLAPPAGRLSVASLAAAVVGALVFFLVNSAELAGILAASGADGFLGALLDGLEIRLLVLAGAIALGLVSTLAISRYPAMSPLVILPFVAFRQALSGHFQARHDRSRLLGLFDATLEVHRTMGSEEVTSRVVPGGLATAALSRRRGASFGTRADRRSHGGCHDGRYRAMVARGKRQEPRRALRRGRPSTSRTRSPPLAREHWRIPCSTRTVAVKRNDSWRSRPASGKACWPSTARPR